MTSQDDAEVELQWSDLTAPNSEPDEVKGRPGVQCLCGRFARYLGGRHYYNGTFNCYSYDVRCSRCGVVTVECV